MGGEGGDEVFEAGHLGDFGETAIAGGRGGGGDNGGGGVEVFHEEYGPRNRSPLKWIMWSGASAIQTSVSQAMAAQKRQ